jgi:hypothetical protein
MELEIGMYVRTINGKIWIIKSQQAISGHRKDIINASYDIIDLIEIGDYVNGIKITDIENDNKGKYVFGYGAGGMEGEIWFYNNDIKSIVTKEAFESMEYRIGE